jgi:hypothetical protein
MRKLFVLVLCVLMTVGLAAPSRAAKPTRSTYASSSVNAFWYFSDQIARNTTRDTVWYVGAYVDQDGAVFSDLYVETQTCRSVRNRTTCEFSSKYGYSDLSDGVFTLDTVNLTAAHIEGTYVLEEYDSRGRLIGSTPTSIVADIEGTGDIQNSGGKSTYCDPFICIRSTFVDRFRQAEATGTVNGTDLGETYDANIANSTYTEVDRLK